jgi:ferredoxin
MCVPECPVGAIVGDKEIDEDQLHFIDLNARLAKNPTWKPITKPKPPLPDHEQWKTVRNKISVLDRHE